MIRIDFESIDGPDRKTISVMLFCKQIFDDSSKLSTKTTNHGQTQSIFNSTNKQIGRYETAFNEDLWAISLLMSAILPLVCHQWRQFHNTQKIRQFVYFLARQIFQILIDSTSSQIFWNILGRGSSTKSSVLNCTFLERPNFVCNLILGLKTNLNLTLPLSI